MKKNNNNIYELINNIRGFASDEARVTAAIAATFNVKDVRSWTSFDKYNLTKSHWVKTKELHWGFDFIGAHCELRTIHDGKFELSVNEKISQYYWDTKSGHFVWISGEDDPLTRHIEGLMYEALLKVSSKSSPKIAFPKTMSWGNYIVWSDDAEIICQNMETKMTYRMGHTPFGGLRRDTDFPVEIFTFIKTNFLRK